MTLSRPGISFLPETAVLEMTYSCNHSCLFCSCPWYSETNSFKKSEELSTANWKEVLNILSEYGVSHICFTGGEALLRPDIFDILQHAATLKVKVLKDENGELAEEVKPLKLYLLSNGKTVDGKILDGCRELNIQLSISLPGLTTFRELTGGGDADKVLKVFREARSRGLSTVAGITVTRKNLHELYETISAAFLAGATEILLNRFLEGGRGLLHAKDLALDREELVQMLDTAE